MDQIVVQGPRGPIIAVKKEIVVIPTTNSLPPHDIAIAVTLVRWGCKGVQLLFPSTLDQENRSEICRRAAAICNSLATGTEKWSCDPDLLDGHDDSQKPVYSVNIGKTGRHDGMK